MSKKLKLTRLELETASGKAVSLTIEEARELHEQLHEMFGKTAAVINTPIVIRDYPYYPKPWWYDIHNADSNGLTARYTGSNITLTAHADP